MGTASTTGVIIVSGNDSAGHRSVYHIVRLRRHYHASGPRVILCRNLLSHRFQLGLFPTAHKERNQETNRQVAKNPEGRDGVLGQMTAVIRLTSSGLRNKRITQICILGKRAIIVAIAQQWPEPISDILLPGIGKGRDSVATGTDPPVPVLHTDQQEDAVPILTIAIAVIVIEVIGICLLYTSDADDE